ncbi:MAG: beta-galactosidase [Bryobacteraceae bacterium]
MRALIPIIFCAIAPELVAAAVPAIKELNELFAPDQAAMFWTQVHCDLSPTGNGGLRASFNKGYERTGMESSRLPFQDWSSWRSFRFDVENQNAEPLSVYVRLSSRKDHPASDTYTGGTFDGFVIGPGSSTVEISLEGMRSPTGGAVDPKQIRWLGIFVQPLFIRDGMELKFEKYTRLDLSNPRLSSESARLQRQPYGDLLFKETEPSLRSKRQEVERAIANLENTILEAKRRGIEAAYAEIYPFLARIAFQQRLVAFWQDRSEEQRRALNFLLEAAQTAEATLKHAIGSGRSLPVPPVLDYKRLTIRDGYFRFRDLPPSFRYRNQPVLPFGMLYNHDGPLLRWFTNSETDYGTELVAGGTRHDVERQPIWDAYQKYPDTHRVGWPHADHIIRDAESWEVLGPPVSVCLESPHSRDAVAAMIKTYELKNGPNHDHLVQNMGFEYTYVCYCSYTKRMWADWLRHKYGNVSAANQIWGTRYKDFTSVDMLRRMGVGVNRAIWFDWSSFNLYRFLEQIRWTHDQIRRWKPDEPLTVGSPYYAFNPAFWTGVDEEELADSEITSVVLEENYALDTLMPEYLHALAGPKPVADFEYHGVIHQILPSFLHGDAAISMWWWNDNKHWTPNEPINEWTTSFPQSYTIPLSDLAKAMRDALDIRRLGREIAVLGSAPRPIALLYSKTSMLQQTPEQSRETNTTPYLSEMRRVYNASQSIGLYIGMTTEKKILAGDLQARRILVLPSVEYLPDNVTNKILRWVEGGGTLVVSPDSLVGDEYARPSQAAQLLSLRIRRPEPSAFGETFITDYNIRDLPRMPLLNDSRGLFIAGGFGLEAVARGSSRPSSPSQIIECNPSNVIAHFENGAAALVRLHRGRGVVYWLAAVLFPESWGRFLSFVAENSALKPDLLVRREAGGAVPEVEYRVAPFEGGRLAYFYNSSDHDLKITLQPQFAFHSILDRRTETALSGSGLLLPARETAIVQFQ